MNGELRVVSTDLLKPAYFISEDLAQYFNETIHDDDIWSIPQPVNPPIPPYISDQDRIPNTIFFPKLNSFPKLTTNTHAHNTIHSHIT